MRSKSKLRLRMENGPQKHKRSHGSERRGKYEWVALDICKRADHCAIVVVLARWINRLRAVVVNRESRMRMSYIRIPNAQITLQNSVYKGTRE